MCCQGSATSTSTTQVPKEVLDRYTAANNAASAAATTPFQQYSTDPSAFVSPLSATQQAGIQNTNTAAGQAQPYYGAATGTLLNAQSQAAPLYGTAQSDLNSGQSAGLNLYNESNKGAVAAQQSGQGYNNAATGLAEAGTGQVNAQQIGAGQINQFLSPYLGDVMQSTEALQNQSNQQQQAGQLGNAINSGAFGGDRAGIAAANLEQQQNLGNSSTLANIANQGYNTALGAAQQQQGVNLSAGQANRSALQTGAGQLQSIGQQQYAQGLGTAQQQAANAQGEAGLRQNTATGLENVAQGVYGLGSNTANSLAGLGAGAQSAALQGSTAQLAAGQQEQSTNQAGLTSLYNQFLQQQSYPFQTAQFLANVAEGTGSLSGSTTSSTQPTGLFGNALSDRRAKEDIKRVGKAKNGLPIYSFRYKGDPQQVTHIGFMADEVEKKHPEAVGLAGGLKTVDYARATKADGGALMFDPNGGAYGLANGTPGHGGYVPAPTGGAARHIMFQHSPAASTQKGTLGQLQELQGDYNSAKSIYKDGSQIWDAGKSVASGLSGGQADPTSSGLYSRGGIALKRDDGGEIDDPYQSDKYLAERQKGLAAGESAMERAPNAGSGPVSGALSAQESGPKYTLNAPAAPGQQKSSTGSDLQTLGTMANMASTAAPYVADAAGTAGDMMAMLLLNKGGRVHRDDGGATVDTDEFGRPLDAAPVAAGLKPYGDIPAEKYAPTPPERPKGPVPAPMVSPDDVSKQPAFDGSKLDVPMPPPRPSDLDAPAGGLIPQQRRVPVVPPAARTAIADNGDSSAQANMAPGLGAARSAWDAPRYQGPAPSGSAPDPSAYGTDAAGQAAFIRDYAPFAAGRGIDPKFSLAVASAEGLRAISPQNPNGASSVDIDPKTGKPFSFGAFQLNTRNGLGNTALAHGIDPTDPKQANAANKFAMDQMAGGGLKPWRGDAAVTAYQQGNAPATQYTAQGGGNNPQPQQPQQPQQGGGLMDSLSSFFHGHPDGQTSPNGGMGERALMGVLSGLGAVGSYRGQSIVGAALQGLGAGAHGYMDAGKTQADIANTQAHTGLTQSETGATDVGAARNSILPEHGYVLGPDGKLHVIDKSVGSTGVPLMGGVANAATKQAGAVPVSGAAAQPPPPPAPSKIDLTGVGYDKDSSAKANSEVLAGMQTGADRTQSAAYQDSSQKAAQAAQEAATYTRPLVSALTESYQQTGLNTPGAGFSRRAAWANMLNTSARAVGLPDGYFGDADKGKALSDKISTLQGKLMAQGADERSLGALEMMKGANANLDQPPEASSEIAAHYMTDQMRAQDRYKHAMQWKADSPTGTMLGASDDFQAKNGPQKYDRETAQIKDLMLHKSKYIQGLNSGNYSPEEIQASLKKRGLDPSLSRYFVR